MVKPSLKLAHGRLISSHAGHYLCNYLFAPSSNLISVDKSIPRSSSAALQLLWKMGFYLLGRGPVDLVSRTIFGPKLAAILDFEPLGDQETIFNQSYHIFHPQKHMFRDEVCGSVIIRSWGMEYPIFSFSDFFRGGHFENAPGEGAHHKFFLLTLQILILQAVSFQKNISL